jgi:hypothetical protein
MSKTTYIINFPIEPEYLAGLLVGKRVCPGDLSRGEPNAHECKYEDECRACVEKFLKKYTFNLTVDFNRE